MFRTTKCSSSGKLGRAALWYCIMRLYYTVRLQMNGAVSKVNKKFISHLTRAKLTPSAAETVQVSHALPAVRSLVITAGLRRHLVN